MTIGPGKYDDVCTMVREQVGGQVVVIVLGGNRGNGFACQTGVETMIRLPDLLEEIAKQIREDAKGSLS
jgi:hypothetical protein